MALTQIQLAMLQDGILTADTAGRLKMADGFVNSAKMAAGAARANWGAGGLLQVVQTVSNSQTGYTGTSFQTVSSLSTSITPSSTSSKILVMLNMTWGLQNNTYAFMKLQRNGSDISAAKGSPTGSQTAASLEMQLSLNTSTLEQHGYNSTFLYLDSPASASSTTYSIVVSPQQGSSLTMYLNRGYSVTGDGNNIAGISSMTLMEIAG